MSHIFGRPTRQQILFARLHVIDGLSLAASYRTAYPPRGGARRDATERIEASRLRRHPYVSELIAILEKGKIDAREVSCDSAWRILLRLEETIQRVKRTPPPPEERTRMIFERLAPRRPAIVPELLEPSADKDSAHAREIMKFVREQRQAQAAERITPPAESEPPSPAPLAPVFGHWEYQRIPGSFGRATFRPLWVRHEPVGQGNAEEERLEAHEQGAPDREGYEKDRKPAGIQGDGSVVRPEATARLGQQPGPGNAV
jgi:hypothetical protein